MMHIDNKHRILPICIFQNVEDFMFCKDDFGTNPIYMLIGHELHGYNVLEENKPCKLADNVKFVSNVSDIPDTFKNGEVAYVFSENQIYQKWDDVLTKGYVFPVQVAENEFAIASFSDPIKIEKLEVYNTCEDICRTFFQVYDFETGNGKLKPIYEKHFFYCKENRCLYAIVDDQRLNCIYHDIGYGKIDSDTLVVSKSRKLFKNGQRCESFSFVYDDMVWNIKFS